MGFLKGSDMCTSSVLFRVFLSSAIRPLTGKESSKQARDGRTDQRSNTKESRLLPNPTNFRLSSSLSRSNRQGKHSALHLAWPPSVFVVSRSFVSGTCPFLSIFDRLHTTTARTIRQISTVSVLSSSLLRGGLMREKIHAVMPFIAPQFPHFPTHSSLPPSLPPLIPAGKSNYLEESQWDLSPVPATYPPSCLVSAAW